MKYIIYRITIADFTYIGSTADWHQRQITHKSGCYNENNKEYNKKLYKTIRENGGWNAIEKSPIEEYECDNSIQARIREEHWRREYNAQLNMRHAHRTREEHIEYDRERSIKYHAENRETILQKQSEYRAANRERILLNGKEKMTCDCGCIINRRNISTHKQTKKHIDRLALQQQNIPIL